MFWITVVIVLHRHDVVGVRGNDAGTEYFAAGLDHELIKYAPGEAAKTPAVNLQRTPVSVPQSVPVGSLLHQVT